MVAHNRFGDNLPDGWHTDVGNPRPESRWFGGGHYGSSMPKISLIAKLTAVDGKIDELEAAMRHVIDEAEEEPGLEVYSVHAAQAEPGVYWFFEVYADDAAFAAHGKGERMRAAMGGFGGLLDGRPEITMLTPIAAKGLDL